MRLIDADKVMKLIPTEEYNARVAIAIAIANAPTVDAVEVKHGHWIYREYGYPLAHNFYTCSVCGSSRGLNIDNYCPHCGAKMDEEKQA